MTTLPSDAIIGRLIDGRYEVLHRVARGGMATVYRAVDRRLDREVAVKVMHAHLAESEDFITRFRREARAAARLSHPNVVAVYDQGLWEDSFYLTMEFVEGEDLRALLRREGPLPLGRALEITRAVLDALAAAHRRDLVHRDIKPENVMIAADGTIKVTDFGLARAVSDATAASTGTVLGTVAYLAPELVTTGVATAGADVYATGILLYEMLTGHQPFTGDLPINVAFQHVNSRVPSPSAELPWLPTEVDDLVAALTARDPQERLQDGEEALARAAAATPALSQELLERRAPRPGTSAGVDDDETAPLTVAQSSGTVALPLGGIDPEKAATPAPTRRGRSPWLGAVLVVLVAGALAAWYFLMGPGAFMSMPGVVGLTTERATAVLEEAGLTVTPQLVNHDTVPKDEVITTVPGPGQRVARGGEVTLQVSKGVLMLAVPDVVDLPRDDALQAIAKAGFPEPGIEELYHDTTPAGGVISVTPGAGESVAHSTVLQLAVSKGREPVTAPAVAGMSEADAVAALQAVGLTPVVGEGENSTEVAAGLVIRQSPAPGEGQLHRGDSVTIVVSQGPPLVEVPDVFGQSTKKATQMLEHAGFEVNVEKLLGGVFGTVHSQDPAAGTLAPLGSRVTISIV